MNYLILVLIVNKKWILNLYFFWSMVWGLIKINLNADLYNHFSYKQGKMFLVL